jgi:DNA primase
VGRFDLDTAEGRANALDRGVPLVAQIKDHSLRDEYARRLAGLVGVDDPLRVVSRVRGMVRAGARPNGSAAAPAAAASSKVDESVASVEREVLKVALQLPAVAGPQFDALPDDAFLVDAHQRLRGAIAAAGGTAAAVSGPAWTSAVEMHLDEALRSGVHALAVEPLRAGTDSQDRYADAVLARLQEIVAARQITRLKGRLQRINPIEAPEEHARMFGELISLESYRRTLRERAIGGQ